MRLNNLTPQFYKDLAWGGLTGTSAFLGLSTGDQTRITNELAVEFTGNSMNDTDNNTIYVQKGAKAYIASCNHL